MSIALCWQWLWHDTTFSKCPHSFTPHWTPLRFIVLLSSTVLRCCIRTCAQRLGQVCAGACRAVRTDIVALHRVYTTGWLPNFWWAHCWGSSTRPRNYVYACVRVVLLCQCFLLPPPICWLVVLRSGSEPWSLAKSIFRWMNSVFPRRHDGL